jgi:hypothetical protein
MQLRWLYLHSICPSGTRRWLALALATDSLH